METRGVKALQMHHWRIFPWDAIMIALVSI